MMRTERSGGTTYVYLSRRNIEALLAKLNGLPRDSECTIIGPYEGPEVTVVIGEENEEHYNPARNERIRGKAGGMHPDTESALTQDVQILPAREPWSWE